MPLPAIATVPRTALVSRPVILRVSRVRGADNHSLSTGRGLFEEFLATL